MNEIVTIVGVGNIGSKIAYMIATYLNSNNNNIKRLIVIDNDCICNNDLPYLSLTKSSKITSAMPKVYAVKRSLSDINDKLNCDIHYCTFDKYLQDNDLPDHNFIIDCRDTKHRHEKCSMKLNIDGHYGLIDFNPSANLSQKSFLLNYSNSRYTMKNSDYYGWILSSICVNLLVNEKLRKKYNGIYTLDLSKASIKLYKVKGEFK